MTPTPLIEVGKPRCYFVGNDDQGGIAFVETSRINALKRRNAVAAELGIDLIDVRVREVEDADISGLPLGEVAALGDYELIVKRGIYGHGEGVQDTCPKCNKPNMRLYEFDDGWYCNECETKAELETNQ